MKARLFPATVLVATLSTTLAPLPVQASAAPEHVAAVARVTDPALTAVRNDAGLLPLGHGKRSVLVTGWNSAIFTPVETVAGGFTARGAPATARPAALPSDQTIAATAALAADHDLTVVLTNKAWDTTVTEQRGTQRRLVAALLATGKPVVGLPVTIPTAEGAGTVLYPYGHSMSW